MIFQYTASDQTHLVVKSRTQQVISFDPGLTSIYHIQIGEQSELTLRVSEGHYDHTIYLIALKGSQITVHEDQPWQGKMRWHIFLIEPYSQVLMSTRLRCGDERIQSEVIIEHEADFTTSDINTRAIMSGTGYLGQDVSLCVPEGRRGCRAHQQAHILNLTDHPKIDIIPRLLVASDDTQCSHGVGIRSLRDRDLFYLMSRGIDRIQAQELVLDGFLRR